MVNANHNKIESINKELVNRPNMSHCIRFQDYYTGKQQVRAIETEILPVHKMQHLLTPSIAVCSS